MRAIAKRLRADGLSVWFDEWEIRPGDSILAKIEEGLEHSRVLVLCMSAHAFGSDWAQLEAGTFRFRDPLNKERRFIPLRLDGSPIKGALAQFLYIDWFQNEREQAYAALVEACLPQKGPTVGLAQTDQHLTIIEGSVTLEPNYSYRAYAFSADKKRALTTRSINNAEQAPPNGAIQLWDVETGQCLRVIEEAPYETLSSFENIAWSADERFVIGASTDSNIYLFDVETGKFHRTFEGHTRQVWDVQWNADGRHILSSSFDKTIRLWDVATGHCLRVFEGHLERVRCVRWSSDEKFILSCADDNTLRLWEVETGQCLRVFKGHNHWVMSVAWSADQRLALSGSCDRSMRLWDVESGRCLRIFEGHTSNVEYISWSTDQRYALTGSPDSTVHFWDVPAGKQIAVILTGTNHHVRGLTWTRDKLHVFAGTMDGQITLWNAAKLVGETPVAGISAPSSVATDQVQYTNAKILLVGDTNSGKTGLTHRLATGKWKPSEDSTVGAWSTQWPLKDSSAEPNLDREIWLWDFGGQADQRLIHQLYMDHTALILLLFNADQEDVLPGLRDWQTALRRCVKDKIPNFLVAGRIDAGFKASRGKLQAFAKEQALAYYETSAKSGEGCNELRKAMIDSIPWALMEMRTSPRIFKLIKDEILKLRDEGQVLHTFKELRELLLRRLPDEPRFTDETLQTVISLLDGPGVVKELDYGTYVLLAPEWINAYAQAVIRTLRSTENDLGALPLRSIAEGQLIYQSIGRDGIPIEMKRLPPTEERVVLGEMERQLEQRGLCLRQGDKLVFPSHCGRDRPAELNHPSVFVSYAVTGFLDDIYATLVVKLADSESFKLKELWREAADFVTLVGDHHMGLKLTRETGSNGDISVYFGNGVTQEEQVIFANYIHAHLEDSCEKILRLRHYVCPKCHTSKGNPEVLMRKLLTKKQRADTECDGCGERFPLWDALEKKFASEAVRRQVEELQADDLAKLNSRRKGKLLVLDVGARITSANQKWYEIPQEEDDGIDIVVEFTDENGIGVGKGLYLQLKAGNSHLSKRKTDGVEVFAIKKPRWVKTWMNQLYPVMLVIGTFFEDEERNVEKEKVEFSDVRWMEISSVLKRESENGKKSVKQIEFKGERLDMTSVRNWREKVLAQS